MESDVREFNGLAAFAVFAAELGHKVDHAKHAALEKAATIIETEAKRVLGTHDYGWPPLKPETIARKTTGDSPLLETGDMRDSISHQVSGDEARVGSNNDEAVWHELGTAKIPPRSFLVGAATRKIHEVGKEIGDVVVARSF